MNVAAWRTHLAALPVLRRLAGVHANHKRIAASALAIAILTGIAKLFVAGREIAIAWRYGVSTTVDAYQLALTIVTWLPMMLISVMTVVFVPLLVALSNKEEERRRFVRELNGTVLLVGLGLASMLWLAAPSGARLFAGALGPPAVELTIELSRLMSPVAFLFIWVGYLSARLQSRERFAYAITEAVPALIIAAAVFAPLAASPALRLGWSTAIGFAIQVMVLAFMVVRAEASMGGFAWRHRAPEWRSLYRDLGTMALGQVIFTLALPIDQAFAARISPGAVAEYGYATRLVTLITALATMVFTRALLPIFSRAVADGQSAMAGRQARQWSILMMAMGLILVAVTWMFAEQAVGLLFGRGAFTAADVARVAHVLRYGVLQVPFLFAGMALVPLIAARGGYSTLLWIACGSLALKLAMNFLLAEDFALAGLMSATAVMYAFSFASQYLVSRK